MSENQKPELTPQQISALIQIMNTASFAGKDLEFFTQLKQALIAILKEKQAEENKPH